MSNVLEELWYGNIVPCEQCAHTPEMQELTKLTARHRENLEAMLTDEQRGVLDKLTETSYELGGFFEREAFNHGFRLGMQIAVEVFSKG